jgi:hypothetical protein
MALSVDCWVAYRHLSGAPETLAPSVAVTCMYLNTRNCACFDLFCRLGEPAAIEVSMIQFLNLEVG